ncbi:NAD(+) diphosphatase [Clostridium saccharobutylicum]|uniref:NAD(+) diphosphatase n=1 Tax=Clostridium saccharobutylicum TaxID=169679 RepID=A0A1S8NI14_CLOSA|nr:NAD(+) diphosphatase [Clostridium saccharobutylicum]OOM16048.1 NADH pyrophosphatase [Clostridium saccharobutylicum]
MGDNFKIISNIFRKGNLNDLCFMFFKGNLLIKKKDDNITIPIFDDIKKLNIKYENDFFIGTIGEKCCFAVEAIQEVDLFGSFELMPLYEFGSFVKEELFLAAGRATQILNWDKTHRFCGKCGSKTENKNDEIAKFCPNCNNVMYPVICPAIIVAVINDDKILLAHNKGFKNNKYSLIAGFVEAGEDLESAVKREVFEEVGIKIKNINYYTSSPWSFPNSLMIGFTAEYESGEIKVDGEEIMHADWFTKDNFPNIPDKFTLARKIIDSFTDKQLEI